MPLLLQGRRSGQGGRFEKLGRLAARCRQRKGRRGLCMCASNACSFFSFATIRIVCTDPSSCGEVKVSELVVQGKPEEATQAPEQLYARSARGRNQGP